jgi:hypothetical protein
MRKICGHLSAFCPLPRRTKCGRDPSPTSDGTPRKRRRERHRIGPTDCFDFRYRRVEIAFRLGLRVARRGLFPNLGGTLHGHPSRSPNTPGLPVHPGLPAILATEPAGVIIRFTPRLAAWLVELEEPEPILSTWTPPRSLDIPAPDALPVTGIVRALVPLFQLLPQTNRRAKVLVVLAGTRSGRNLRSG